MDAGIEHRTVATLAVAVRRSNHSAGSHPLLNIEMVQVPQQNAIRRKNSKKMEMHPITHLSDTRSRFSNFQLNYDSGKNYSKILSIGSDEG
jgi:hypothetical protein